MRIETVRCAALGAPVTRIVDFEGLVDHVICSQYQRASGTCRLKRSAGAAAPLSRLLERVGEDLVGDRTVTCSLR